MFEYKRTTARQRKDEARRNMRYIKTMPQSQRLARRAIPKKTSKSRFLRQLHPDHGVCKIRSVAIVPELRKRRSERDPDVLREQIQDQRVRGS